MSPVGSEVKAGRGQVPREGQHAGRRWSQTNSMTSYVARLYVCMRYRYYQEYLERRHNDDDDKIRQRLWQTSATATVARTTEKAS